MKKPAYLGIAIALTVLLLGGAACKKKATVDTNATVNVNAVVNTNQIINTNAAVNVNATINTNTTATGAITIGSRSFSPSSLSVKKGTTVTWTNNGGTIHQVVWDNGTPGSKILSNGNTYPFTFDTAGTFTYHCGIHSDMTGLVTVTE